MTLKWYWVVWCVCVCVWMVYVHWYLMTLKWYWVLWCVCVDGLRALIYDDLKMVTEMNLSNFFLEYHHFFWLNFGGFKTHQCHTWYTWGKGNCIKCFGGETWTKETSLKMGWVLKWTLKRLGGREWVYLAKNRNMRQVVVNMILNLQVPYDVGSFIDWLRNCWLLNWSIFVCHLTQHNSSSKVSSFGLFNLEV